MLCVSCCTPSSEQEERHEDDRAQSHTYGNIWWCLSLVGDSKREDAEVAEHRRECGFSEFLCVLRSSAIHNIIGIEAPQLNWDNTEYLHLLHGVPFKYTAPPQILSDQNHLVGFHKWTSFDSVEIDAR